MQSTLEGYRPQTFQQNLNSVDGNIKFTIEHTCQTDKGYSISFKDSQITMLGNGSIEIDVCRKATPISKYLDFVSQSSAT